LKEITLKAFKKATKSINEKKFMPLVIILIIIIFFLELSLAVGAC